MSSVSVSVGHVTRYHMDIPLVRRVIEVKTYRWNGETYVLDVSEPICVFESSANPGACVWSCSAVLGSLHGSSATVASLSTTLVPRTTARKRQEISNEQRTQPESVTPPPPPPVSPRQHLQPAGDRGPFFGDRGMLPREPCLNYRRVAPEFAVVYPQTTS